MLISTKGDVRGKKRFIKELEFLFKCNLAHQLDHSIVGILALMRFSSVSICWMRL